MERLLADAQKLTGVKYDIRNLSDVYSAIHVIQEELGVTGTTAKEATETLQGSLGMLKASWDNFLSGSGKLSQVAESVKDVVKNVTRIISEAIPDIIDGFVESLPEFLKMGQDILQKIIEGILRNLPQLTQVAFQLMQQLITGIAQMLPSLIPQAVQCVITLAEALLDNVDLLIDAGIQLIFGLIDGLIEALPILIDKAPEIIEKLVVAISNNLPKIIEAGILLIIKLVDGLIRALPKLSSAIPKIIKTMFDGLVLGVYRMAEAGANLVRGIWQGIINMRQWIWNKMKEFCNGIIDKVKGFFGIHSPSKVFQNEIGKFLGLGLGKGFEKSLPNVFKDMKTAVDFETQKLSTNLSTQATFGRTLNANITLESSDIYMDSAKVGRATAPSVARTLQIGGAY